MQRTRNAPPSPPSPKSPPEAFQTQEGNHIFTSFVYDEELMDFQTQVYERRMRDLEDMDVEVGGTLDWEFIEKIGMQDIFVRRLRRNLPVMEGSRGFTCNAWEIVLSIREPIYIEIVHEFLASFSFNEHYVKKGDYKTHQCIKFRLCGKWFKFTLVDFAVWMGLYTENQTDLPTFEEYMAICEKEKSKDFNPTEEWKKIGKGAYSKSNTKESALIDTQNRVLHRMLVGTLRQRKAIHEKVPEGDMWLLTQLINEDRFTNIPYVLANFFVDTVHPRDRSGSGLCGGQYITRLARNLNLLTDEVVDTLTLVGYLDYIDRPLLQGMKVLVKGEEKGEYFWNQTPISVQLDETFATPKSGGEGSSKGKEKEGDEKGEDTSEILDLLSDLAGKVTMSTIESREQYRRLKYNLHELKREVAWQTNAMDEYFSQVGFRPSKRFQPGPSWPEHARAPTGYADWDEWVEKNDP